MSTSPGVHLSTKNNGPAFNQMIQEVHRSFPLPENEMIPKSVIDHKITDFSIIAVAASRAEGLSPDDLGKVISFPEASSDKAQRNDKRVEDSSDLSDYQYPPGSDAPAFIRERPNRDFPDRRKRVKLSDTSTPPASLNVSKSADPEPLTKRKPENRNKRRRDAKYGDRNRKAETLTSTLPTMDASKFNISSTGWQGKNPRGIKNIQEIVKGWKDGTILIPLAKFLRIPHEGLVTRIRDFHGRHWCTRSFASEKMRTEHLPAFARDADWLYQRVQAGKMGFSMEEREANHRGSHWSSNFGHDRNYKSAPSLTKWHKENEDLIEHFFRTGGPAHAINKFMNTMFAREFPLIAARYKQCGQALGINPLYGHFYNFCVNHPGSKPRVHCGPHVDWKNLAVGICVLFVYGIFNSSERCWLVIWEAGVILEMPPGVFLMYPSSLFVHFNIDVCDIDLVTTDGALPTRDNTHPLRDVNGRGSCVWFNQACMFQCAELGFGSVTEAKLAGLDGQCDALGLISKGYFPV